MSELRWYLLLIGAVILLWIWYSGRRQSKAARHDVFKNVQAHHDDVLMKDEAGNPLQFDDKPAKSFEEALAEVNAMEAEEELVASAEVEDAPGPSLAEADAAMLDDDERPEPVLPQSVDDDIVIDTVADDLPREPDPLAIDAAASGSTVVESEAPPQEETPADEPLQLVMLYVVAPEDQPFPGAAVLKSFHVHKLRFGEHDIFHRETSSADGRRIVFSISNMLKPGTLVPEEVEHSDIYGLGVFMQLPSAIEPIEAFKDMLHTAQHLATALGGELRDEKLQPLTQETITLLREQMGASSG